MDKYFAGRKHGFFVDVGAHHPVRFSNTYALYKKGWSGINIDIRPGARVQFERKRPRDIFVEAAIGDVDRTGTYYMFDESAFNTVDDEVANVRRKQGHVVREAKAISIRSLESVLDDTLARTGNTSIDMMSIDVEGMDEAVLQSNNWKKYRPAIILAECLGATLAQMEKDPVARLLAGNDYVIYAKFVNTVVFKDVASAL